MSNPGPDGAAPLTISYLFSQFPVPTQTFAVSDIEALRQLGHTVLVHTLKPPAQAGRGPAAPADLSVQRPTLAGALRWPALLWRRKGQVRTLLRLIAPHIRHDPATALTALLCIPRVIEIVEEVIRSRSDVVHLFWSRHAALALPVLRDLGIPAARTCFVGAYDLVADDFLVRLALDTSQAVFSHAEANRPFIEERAPAELPVHIVHRGIPLPELDEGAVRDGSLWVTASALVVEKNVEAVLRAFALARAVKPDLRLVICGDGPDRRRLEQVAEQSGCAEAVRFEGHIDRQALFRIMHGAAVFLLLSKKASERLPNVIKEALWSGCAVISSRSEGIDELVPDPGIGIVIDPDDNQAMACAVETVLAETAAMADVRRQRARALIASRFSHLDSMGRYVAAWGMVRSQR